MCGDDDDVCYAAYDGRPSKYGWSQGRGGRKWQRWWRRSTRRRWAMRRMHAHIHHYYQDEGKPNYSGVTWQVRWLVDPEVQQHLFVVRLGGEGRYGTQWGRRQDWSWNNQNPSTLVPWIEANGEGQGFHFLVVGKFAKGHKPWACCHHDDKRARMRRRRADPYDRWDQHQLQRLRHDD